jgi:hypothetical protein
MAYLEQFSKEERDILISLPYRVGVWVSSRDQTGDNESDEIEMQTLENIIGSHAHGMFETALVHEIMSVAYSQPGLWPHWAKKTETVLDECHKALEIIAAKSSGDDADKEVSAYKKILMQIAFEVARSYNEFDDESSGFEKFMAHIRIMIDNLIGKIRREKYASEELLNISLDEDIALSELAKALHWPA